MNTPVVFQPTQEIQSQLLSIILSKKAKGIKKPELIRAMSGSPKKSISLALRELRLNYNQVVYVMGKGYKYITFCTGHELLTHSRKMNSTVASCQIRMLQVPEIMTDKFIALGCDPKLLRGLNMIMPPKEFTEHSHRIIQRISNALENIKEC
jgi:hypothetical protein